MGSLSSSQACRLVLDLPQAEAVMGFTVEIPAKMASRLPKPERPTAGALLQGSPEGGQGATQRAESKGCSPSRVYGRSATRTLPCPTSILLPHMQGARELPRVQSPCSGLDAHKCPGQAGSGSRCSR